MFFCLIVSYLWTVWHAVRTEKDGTDCEYIHYAEQVCILHCISTVLYTHSTVGHMKLHVNVNINLKTVCNNQYATEV